MVFLSCQFVIGLLDACQHPWVRFFLWSCFLAFPFHGLPSLHDACISVQKRACRRGWTPTIAHIQQYLPTSSVCGAKVESKRPKFLGFFRFKTWAIVQIFFTSALLSFNVKLIFAFAYVSYSCGCVLCYRTKILCFPSVYVDISCWFSLLFCGFCI